ncbi:porimin isoform X2 [Empidonax traillii]|uniref:porimin isoform X2 n=1 Tax=Empidonax traillii TaxID=164674 RepID=UPI000FFD5637|nr:porimin isoform X2 [Empidonax traillii]
MRLLGGASCALRATLALLVLLLLAPGSRNEDTNSTASFTTISDQKLPDNSSSSNFTALSSTQSAATSAGEELNFLIVTRCVHQYYPSDQYHSAHHHQYICHPDNSAHQNQPDNKVHHSFISHIITTQYYSGDHFQDFFHFCNSHIKI